MVITINLKISIMNENINVRDADDMNDEYDDGEWMERIQQPECHDAFIPIVNHNTTILNSTVQYSTTQFIAQ